jgi:hypothetical protein
VLVIVPIAGKTYGVLMFAPVAGKTYGVLMFAPVAGKTYGVLMLAPVAGKVYGVFVFGIAIEDQRALDIRRDERPALCALLVSGGEVGAARKTDLQTSPHNSSTTRCTPNTALSAVPSWGSETTSENRRSFIGNLSFVQLMIARTDGEGYWELPQPKTSARRSHRHL